MTLFDIEETASITGQDHLDGTIDDSLWTGRKVGLQFRGLLGQK